VALAAKPSAPGKAGCCALNVCIVRSRSAVRAMIVFFITSMLDVLLLVGYKVTHFFPIMFRYVVFFELVGESEGDVSF
jgi:hypothetical protein